MTTETATIHRADWFANAKWGIFNHYLVSEMSPAKNATTADAWNRLIDNFDVKALAAQTASRSWCM